MGLGLSKKNYYTNNYILTTSHNNLKMISKSPLRYDRDSKNSPKFPRDQNLAIYVTRKNIECHEYRYVIEIYDAKRQRPLKRIAHYSNCFRNIPLTHHLKSENSKKLILITDNNYYQLCNMFTGQMHKSAKICSFHDEITQIEQISPLVVACSSHYPEIKICDFNGRCEDDIQSKIQIIKLSHPASVIVNMSDEHFAAVVHGSIFVYQCDSLTLVKKLDSSVSNISYDDTCIIYHKQYDLIVYSSGYYMCQWNWRNDNHPNIIIVHPRMIKKIMKYSDNTIFFTSADEILT